MPGFLETTLHQGYDFLSPYAEKAQPYVEKARNNVPLVDPALKRAEELVPVLITRADQFAEPHVQKMRPYVEPRIEQVKEKVTPYVDEGVKKYGVLREEGVKYYNVGLEKVEQVKGFKDAKETQIREFKEARENQIREFAEPKVEKIKEFKEAKVTQIKGFTDPKVEKIKDFKEAKTTQIREFTDPKVEKIKEFKEARVTQIREFAEPKVEKIKGAMEPKVAGITASKEKMQKLLRVPGSLDLQGLNSETLLGKVASGLEKVEVLLDRYVPLTEEQKKDDDSVSSASDSSCVRINHSVVSIITRLLFVFMAKITLLLSFSVQLKTMYMDGSLKVKLGKSTTDMKNTLISKVGHAKAEGKKFIVTLKGASPQSILLRIKDKFAPTKAKIAVKARQLFTQVTEKLAPVVASLTQTSVSKKAMQMAVVGSEKTLGKEKTTIILSKAETCIPVAWKAAPTTKAAASSPVAKHVPKVVAPPTRIAKMEEQAVQQPQAEPVRKRTGGKDKGEGNY